MNKEIIELREVIVKLVPLLTGKGLTVTQRGGQAFVRVNHFTRKPESVNIPNISDNADESFIRAIQGFIDHEVAHVLITNWDDYLIGKPGVPHTKAEARRQVMRNIMEDTMIERELPRRFFPGSRRNIADMRKHFIEKITKEAVRKCKGDEKLIFQVILVPMMRALAGHDEFQEYMDKEGFWQNPYVAGLLKQISPATLKMLPVATTTKQMADAADEIDNILYPPPPPPPKIHAIDPAEGYTTGGDEIHIEGDNLIRIKEVRIGGKKAKWQLIDATAAAKSGNMGAALGTSGLIVTTPKTQNAGPADVTVVTDGGKDTLEKGFEYLEAPQQQQPQQQQQPSPPQDCDGDGDNDENDGESQDKPDQKAGEGDGDGERDHSDQDPGDEDEQDAGDDAGDEEDDDAQKGEGKSKGKDKGDEEEEQEDAGADGDGDDDAAGDEEEEDEGAGEGDEEDSEAEADADGEDSDAEGDADEDAEGDDDEEQPGSGEGEDEDDDGAGDDEADADEGDAGEEDADGDDGLGGDEDDSDDQSGGSDSDDEDEDQDGGSDAGDGDDDEEAGDDENGASGGPGEASENDDGDEDGSSQKPEEKQKQGDSVAIDDRDHDSADHITDNGEEGDGGGGVGGDGSAHSSIFDDLEDEAFENADIASQVAIFITNEAVSSLHASDYTVYTRELDRIEHIKFPEKMPANWIPNLDEETRQMTGRMAKDIERMLAAQSYVIRTPGWKSGRLHAPALHRLTTGDDRIFNRRQEHKSKETAVMLLNDNSGSMQGEKLRTAMVASFALASTLERVNIPNEVLGFTTTDWFGIPASIAQAMNEDIAKTGVHYSRTLPIVMPIYKEFDERINATVKSRIAYMANAQKGLQGNIDGESLEYAAVRLLKRKEKRKVMIVLSDGHPVAAKNADGHLYLTIRKLMKMGIELVGIGIMDRAVEHFYPNHTVLNNIADLPGQVMQELKTILTT